VSSTARHGVSLHPVHSCTGKDNIWNANGAAYSVPITHAGIVVNCCDSKG